MGGTAPASSAPRTALALAPATDTPQAQLAALQQRLQEQMGFADPGGWFRDTMMQGVRAQALQNPNDERLAQLYRDLQALLGSAFPRSPEAP